MTINSSLLAGLVLLIVFLLLAGLCNNIARSGMTDKLTIMLGRLAELFTRTGVFAFVIGFFPDNWPYLLQWTLAGVITYLILDTREPLVRVHATWHHTRYDDKTPPTYC